MRHVVYVHTMPFANRSKVSAEGIRLNARVAITLRTLCIGEVGLWRDWHTPLVYYYCTHTYVYYLRRYLCCTPPPNPTLILQSKASMGRLS